MTNHSFKELGVGQKCSKNEQSETILKKKNPHSFFAVNDKILAFK